MKNTKAFRRRSEKRRQKLWAKKIQTLEYQLTEILSCHVGERGESEGAVETLVRIIAERKQAMEKLALIAMNEKFFIR
jgi:hypothetical protein